MIPLRRTVLACAGGLLLAPLAAAAQSQERPEELPSSDATAAPQPKEDSAAKDAPKDAAAEDGKRVCRAVRADPSSRRKTRVCRTVEEWRGLNVPL